MRTRLFLEMLLASAVFLVFEVRAEADDWSREWYAEVTASSYMFSLGSVRADHAVWMLEGDAVQHLSGFGHVLLGYWALSDLEKKHDSGHRSSVYESDPYLFYGYDFDFAEGWRLRNRLGLIWVCNEGYDEKVEHLIREWTYAGELKSPCATLFGQVRVVDGRGTFVRCGLKRVIEVAGGMFSIVPHVAMSGETKMSPVSCSLSMISNVGYGGSIRTRESIFRIADRGGASCSSAARKSFIASGSP